MYIYCNPSHSGGGGVCTWVSQFWLRGCTVLWYRVPSDALVATARASQTLCNNDFTQRSASAHLVLVAPLQTRLRANRKGFTAGAHYEIGLSWVG